jgi:hypothetical protein
MERYASIKGIETMKSAREDLVVTTLTYLDEDWPIYLPNIKERLKFLTEKSNYPIIRFHSCFWW